MCKRVFSILLSVIIITGTIPGTVAASASGMDAVYRWNLSVYSSKSADEATLVYYRLPESPGYSDHEEIVNLARSITAGRANDYEKVKAIHDWVAENIWYDADSVIIGSLNVLRNRRSLCAGYASLTAALLRVVGIPAKVISGYVLGDSGNLADFYDTAGTVGNHAWNEAYIGGRWLILDTTWDSNNKYTNGVYSNRAACNQDYFDISLEELSRTHRYLDYTDYQFIDGLIIDSSTREIHGFHDYLAYRENVTELVIPAGVSNIGSFMFQSCANLRSVTIPDSVRIINDYAFSMCPNLSAIVIPDSVTHIGTNTFWRSPNVVLYVTAGSYAESYAIENSLVFTTDTVPASSGDPSSWAVEEVNAAISAGLVPQFLQSGYRQTITRAEYCALAVALYEEYTGVEISGRVTFIDTNDVNVEKMAAVGVVEGVGGNRFDPYALLTREHAATLLPRLANALGRPLLPGPATFVDMGSVSPWAVTGVGQVQAAGIMSGVGNNTFAPKDPYSREQSIITMIRLWNAISG